MQVWSGWGAASYPRPVSLTKETVIFPATKFNIPELLSTYSTDRLISVGSGGRPEVSVVRLVGGSPVGDE